MDEIDILLPSKTKPSENSIPWFQKATPTEYPKYSDNYKKLEA